MNWYFIFGIFTVLLAIGCICLFVKLVFSIDQLTVSKNTAKFVGVAFALLGYFALPTERLPSPSNLLLEWLVPVSAGFFASYYALKISQDHKSELNDFFKQNVKILVAAFLLIFCTFLIGVSEKAFENSAAQSNAPAGMPKAVGS